MTPALLYGAAGLLGALFGVSELVARYRDEPAFAFRSVAGWVYIGINAVASITTLLVAEVFGWTFGWTFGMDAGASPADEWVRAIQVLASGLGSMVLLRSSLFTVRVGSQDVGIGLVAIVQAFLRAAHAAVDRGRGIARDQAVRVMADVFFQKVLQPLPAYCLGLMQYPPSEDQAALARQVENTARMKANEEVKSRLLGLALINFLGERVLLTAVKSLGSQIRNTDADPPQAAPERP